MSAHVSELERIQALETIAGFRTWMGWESSAGSEDALIAHLESAPSGRCDDCHESARLRKKLGKFTLCLGCLGLRMRAGFKSAAPLPSEREGEAA